MKKISHFLFYFFVLSQSYAVYAQLPVATGPGSGLLYFIHTSGDTIFNYDPSQPVSSSNPSVNSIFLPSSSGTIGLAVSNNISASNPSPTFYAAGSSPSYFKYYNGTSWVTTGYPYTGAEMGAGGGAIYCVYSPGFGFDIYKFKGSANPANIFSDLDPASDPYRNDVAADCAGNFYLLKGPPGNLHLYKHDTTGALIDSFIMNGGPLSQYSTASIGGFAISGNKVYFMNNDSLWCGVLTGNTINCSFISAAPIFSNMNDLSSYAASAFSSVTASVDTAYYCNGGPGVQVYATGLGTFTWSVLSGPAVITGSGDTITLTATANSTILLSSSYSSFCGSSTDTVTLIVRPMPAYSMSSNSPVCSGDSLLLVATSVQSGLIYNWSGPNSFSSSAHNPSISNVQLIDSGYYFLTVSLNGCDSTNSVHVSIKPAPIRPIANNNGPLCAGDTLKLNATDSTGGVTYQWYGPNSFSSSLQNPVRTNSILTDSGKYIVASMLNGCLSKPDTTDVVINSPLIPLVSITSIPTVITANQTDTFTAHVSSGCNSPTYQWYMDGVKINGATSNPYSTSLLGGGQISVVVHCSGCVSPDSAMSNIITAPTSVSNIRSTRGTIKVYPNPLTDQLIIEGIQTTTSLQISNMIGQVVYECSTNQTKIIIDTHSLENGMYILELTTPAGAREIRKIIKQ